MTTEEDTAYTINHAIACTATDIASPFIGNMTQRYLGKRVEIGCGHDHGTDKAPPLPAKGMFTGLSDKGLSGSGGNGGYKRMRPLTTRHVPAPASNLKHWWIGEIAGDFGAVPLTVALQHYTPGFMRGLRTLMEPVAAPLFRLGAKRSTSDKEEQNKIVEREMHHLPQALVWTASATVINIITQRLSGNEGKLTHLLTGKLAGSAFSTAMVVGLRALAPEQAQRWDGFTTQHVFEPVKRIVAGEKNWQQRVDKNAKERQI